MSQNTLPPAFDPSSHLSDLAKALRLSPLKGIFKYVLANPNILNLASGIPNAGYFPFETLEGEALLPDTFLTVKKRSPFNWIFSLFGLRNKGKTIRVRVPKYVEDPADPNLAIGLQYGTSRGIPALENLVNDFSRTIFRPAYPNFGTFVHPGNTAGYTTAFKLFLNPGDGFLAEEWMYTSAKSAAEPMGFSPVAVPADHHGMRVEALEIILSNWDENARGMRRPRAMYTVPVGSNPTGTNISFERKKAVYDLCVKYGKVRSMATGGNTDLSPLDIVIIEDDPYYFLQEGLYYPQHIRASAKKSFPETNAGFLSSLVPSYVRVDYQGRVLRLDSFSKTIAPGSRLGWFTGHPVFLERLERFGEASTQAPCGFSQTLITQLIVKEWGVNGYVTWLKGLRQDYISRRDAMTDLFVERFSLTKEFNAESGSDVYVGWKKVDKYNDFLEEKRRPLVSLKPPEAGMFIWFEVHIEELSGLDGSDDPELDTPEKILWDKFAQAGVLVSPGFFFAADSNDERLTKSANFRISFSNADHETMRKVVATIGNIIDELQHLD